MYWERIHSLQRRNETVTEHLNNLVDREQMAVEDVISRIPAFTDKIWELQIDIQFLEEQNDEKVDRIEVLEHSLKG